MASSPKFEYDPLDELFRFVETFIFYFIDNGVKTDDEVDEHSDPKSHTDIQKRFTYSKEGGLRNQNSVYRNLRSSLRTKRKDRFIEAIKSFNCQMDYLVQSNDLDSFLKVRKPEGRLLEFILEQIYARCCSETDLPNITKAKCKFICVYEFNRLFKFYLHILLIFQPFLMLLTANYDLLLWKK